MKSSRASQLLEKNKPPRDTATKSRSVIQTVPVVVESEDAVEAAKRPEVQQQEQPATKGVQQPNELVLHNVSQLLQQLGEQIDAREKKLLQKTETQYQRNEKNVNNVVLNLFTSIVVLMREVVKRSLFHVLKETSAKLKERFDLGTSGTVAFVAQGTQEQENKQNEITVQTLTNTQKAWKEAMKATQPPEADVETSLVNQAQDTFKKLDCHRRVLVVALQTYQTNHLQAEIKFIESVYSIKTKSVKALWQRLQLLIQDYQKHQDQLVSATMAAIASIQRKQEQTTSQLQTDRERFMERLKKLWNTYKGNTLLVDDTNSEANDLRVALDTLLAGTSLDFVQAADLLQKHWQTVAQHVESCTIVGASSKRDVNKAALQKNVDKMLFCAKQRAQVLQNAKRFASTQAWIQELRKWDAAMKQLEKEAHVLRKLAKSSNDVPEACVPGVSDKHSMIVVHRQWKRLIFALAPLAAKLAQREGEAREQGTTMYAVLLNKVGLELKQGLDACLLKQRAIEEEHLDTERAQVSVEEQHFKLLSDKYVADSSYMSSELQGYGQESNKCRELITKLFKLKTWQEHASHLQQQLKDLQPLVVGISKSINVY